MSYFIRSNGLNCYLLRRFEPAEITRNVLSSEIHEIKVVVEKVLFLGAFEISTKKHASAIAKA